MPPLWLLWFSVGVAIVVWLRWTFAALRSIALVLIGYGVAKGEAKARTR